MTNCVRIHRNWLKVIALAPSVLASLATPANVMAQGSTPEQQIGQAAEQRTFNIPPQPLQSALILFGQQSGRTIAADGATVRGLSSPGVQGTMSVDEALRRLLAGTGLTGDGTAGSTITVQKLGAGLAPGVLQLDPVQVQGSYPVPSQAMIDNLPPAYAGGQVATGGQLGLLGNRPIMDTPFNQTSYTAKKAQDQQAKTVRDVLIDDPSVRTVIPDGSGGQDNVLIRGFQVGSDAITYGGLYGILPQRTIMAELAERVEVLKGPSVLLNGMSAGGAVGGQINIVPKRAPDEGLTQLTTSYGSLGQFGGHVDVARRFGPDKQFGVRFNGVFKAGQTAVENNTDQRGLSILGVDFRGEHVRLSLDVGYQHQYVGGVISYLGLDTGVPLPWAPNAQKNQGQPWSFVERRDAFTVARAEIDMTESITAYAAFGIHDERVQGLLTSAVTVTGYNGAATAATPLTTNAYSTYLTGEAGVRASFDTGPIGHEAGVTMTTYENTSGLGFAFGTGFDTNIYNPTVIARPNIGIAPSHRFATQGMSSIGIADTLTAADKRIQLTGGLRLQNVTSQSFDLTTGQLTGGYDQTVLSPGFAVVFKPWQNVSVYGNFIQGLQQGQTVPTIYANAGQVLSPFVSTQYEAGVKVDWGKFTTTASLFQISRPFTLVNVLANTLSLAGEQRNRGLEFNVFGVPAPGVRLLGGLMLLNPVLTKTQDGTNDGWVAPLTPQVNINLAAEWDLPFAPGLTVDARMIYTGSQYVDTTLPRRSLPDWTRFDVGARYAFANPAAKGKPLIARFNVDNVLDANYWAGGTGVTTLFLGQPRTFRVSLTADF